MGRGDAVPTKLYIINLPSYVSETNLRAALAEYPLASLSFARSRYGNWAVLETATTHDMDRVVSDLRTTKLQRLTMIVPGDPEQAGRLERVFRDLKSREVNA